MTAVSKVIAIALLLVFVDNTALTAFFADSQATLPPCCRRDGKHHCAMMDILQQQDNAEASWQTAQRKCAQFPKHSAAFYSAKSAPPSTLVTSLVFSQPTVKAQTETLYRISHSRTRQKRGPPSLV